MKVLIVEDETAAYEDLADALKKLRPDIDIVGNTESVVQTVEWLRKGGSADLIFMDIHLSDGSAFTIFNHIKIETPIVFTTAYDQYAVEAFRVNSIDYLLKPVKREELEQALKKYRKWCGGTDVAEYLNRLSQLAAKPIYKERILVPFREKLIPVATRNIAFFHTANKTTEVYLNNGLHYTLSRGMTLDSIMTSLDPSMFIRANKQFIISRDSVKEIAVWPDSRLAVTLLIDTPERIYVSKNKAPEFKEWVTMG